jgi:hypothetical protein
VVRRTRTGRRGGFRVRVLVPALAPGRYRLVARAGGRRAVRFLRILAPAIPQPAPLAPPPEEPAPVTTPPPPPPPPAPPTLVAAGDIACRPDLSTTDARCRQGFTATLAESLSPDAVAVLGDLQYEMGELENFNAVYDPSWGRLKAITRPAIGNHEYQGDPERDSAVGYFTYFGEAAHPEDGYYRWSLGDWTVFVLNSGAIDYTRTGGGAAMPDDCWPVSCAAGSEQEQWLRAELDSLPDDACVLAYWHHPRFSSGWEGSNRNHIETAPLLDALHDRGAELVLAGHAHNYERFEPTDASGVPDAATGVTQFVVGTGGRNLFEDTGPQQAISETLITDAFGVLELTLEDGSWSARFVSEAGETRDAASGACHGPPA